MITENKDKNEKSLFRRLCDKSLILSCLAILSSRLISYLKESVFSFLFSHADETERAFENGQVYKFSKKLKFRNRISRPVKHFFATQVERSHIVAFYRRRLWRLGYTSVGNVGALFMTFGVYLLMVYFLRLYAFNVENPSASTALAGGAMILISLPLLFSSKPILLMLKESALLSGLFESGGEIKYDPKEKTRNSFGLAILFGSVLGVSSFFFGETKILILLFATIAVLWLLYSPETGLFATAALFPMVQQWLLTTIVTTTLISYFIKVMRGKRNFHLGVPEAFVSILGLCFFFCFLKGGGERAWFALCMVSVYIMFSNLIITPALLLRCISALSLGIGIVCVTYTGGLVQGVLDGNSVAAVAKSITGVFTSSAAFSSYLVVMLPFVLCKVKSHSAAGRVVCYVLAQLCIMYAVLNGHIFLAILIAASLTLFFSVTERRLLEPIILYFGVPVMLLYFTNTAITLETFGTKEVISSWVKSASVGAQHFFFGAGMSEESIALAGVGDTRSMYLQTFTEGGICQALLLVFAVLFSCQRLYTHLGKTGDDNRRIAAALGAASVSAVVLSFGNNLWADSGACFLFWCCLGITSACYKTRMSTEGRMLDEEY